MTRQHMDLHGGDLVVLANALATTSDELRSELERRPWYANDVLRRPEVVEAVLHGTGPDQLAVSPQLLFAVLVSVCPDSATVATLVSGVPAFCATLTVTVIAG